MTIKVKPKKQKGRLVSARMWSVDRDRFKIRATVRGIKLMDYFSTL